MTSAGAGHDRTSGIRIIDANGDTLERLEETEFCQLLGGVWQQVDADAQLTNVARLLKHFALDADGVQAQRRRKPTDAASDD
jgi:hypothetical protein